MSVNSGYQEMLEEMAYAFRAKDKHMSYTESVVKSIDAYDIYRKAEDTMFEMERSLHSETSI